MDSLSGMPPGPKHHIPTAHHVDAASGMSSIGTPASTVYLITNRPSPHGTAGPLHCNLAISMTFVFRTSPPGGPASASSARSWSAAAHAASRRAPPLRASSSASCRPIVSPSPAPSSWPGAPAERMCNGITLLACHKYPAGYLFRASPASDFHLWFVQWAKQGTHDLISVCNTNGPGHSVLPGHP